MATADHLLAPGPRQQDLFLTAALSVLLHGLIIAVALVMPRFQIGTYITVPVSYTVDLVGGEPGGGAQATRPSTAPASTRAPAPAPRATPPVRSAPRATPPVRSAPRATQPNEELTLPGRKTPQKAPSEPTLRPAPITGNEIPRPAPAPVPAAVAQPPAAPAPPGAGQAGSKGSGAEVATGTGSGGGTALAYYLTLVDRTIDENWDRLGGTAGQEVVVRFRALPSGQVRDVELEAGSGNAGLDASALRAIRNSTPLPPFPNLLTESSLNLRYRFVLER